MLYLGTLVGLYEAKKPDTGRFWRKVGTAVVRWPAPILVASAFVVMIGLVAVPGYKPAYNDRWYLPTDAAVNVGFTAADRHFTQARMNPDILMVEANHDMRNPADMLVLDRVAKNVLRTQGIAMVQSIRPRDSIEAMLVAQMVSVHVMAMRCAQHLATANDIAQHDGAARALGRLARTFPAQIEALNRYRARGEPAITVQNVSVGDGGKAIVGNVTQHASVIVSDKAQASAGRNAPRARSK